MPIKRRSSLPSGDDALPVIPAEPQGLVIVAKEKQPTPPPKMTEIYDKSADLRRVGPMSMACGYEAADDPFNVGDTVKLLRTAYDDKNPQEQRYRNRIRNRATAITAMCIVCTGSRKLVTECHGTHCPLWAFRFGNDPFRGQRK